MFPDWIGWHKKEDNIRIIYKKKPRIVCVLIIVQLVVLFPTSCTHELVKVFCGEWRYGRMYPLKRFFIYKELCKKCFFFFCGRVSLLLSEGKDVVVSLEGVYWLCFEVYFFELSKTPMLPRQFDTIWNVIDTLSNDYWRRNEIPPWRIGNLF